MVETMLEMRGVRKSFKTTKVLNGVDLTVQAGSVVGLLGKNGAGKTTLLKCALGLLRPQAGTVTILASEISQLTGNEVSGCLLYALKENEDNSRLIEQLAQAATQIEPEHTRTLIEMLTTHQVDRHNLEAFLDINAPVVNAALGQRTVTSASHRDPSPMSIMVSFWIPKWP